MSWWFTALFLVLFMSGNALATPIKHIIAHIGGMEPVKIGEKSFIPVRIDRLNFKLKSAKIGFEVGTSPIKIEETIVDVSKLTSFPYTVYVPITVTGDGIFDFNGVLHIEALEGEKIFNKEYFDYPLSSLGVFAFEGEVFFGRSSGLAMEAAAINNLKKTNPEYNKLLNKKENIDSEVLRQSFSEEEDEKLKKLRNDAIENIYKLYFERYPIKTEPTPKLLNVVPSSKTSKE
ncbi:MAG: hypothetical protein LBT96_04780 [Campylobacteraceae bacterium]|nr:hypothetical protein [Campylobacteraceae bacterium]